MKRFSLPVAFSFFLALLYGKGSLRFILGIIFSFAFSIAVILCTLGLMDGFEYTLKQALKLSMGDLTIYSRRGFFVVDPRMQQLFANRALVYAPMVQTEGFLVRDSFSNGVMVRGVGGDFFALPAGVGDSLTDNGIIIGKELAKVSDLQVGDEVALSLITGKMSLGTRPSLYGFRVAEIVDHKIYKKNLRLVYVDLAHLQSLLGTNQRVNMIAINKFNPTDPDLVTKVEDLKTNLSNHLDPLMVIRPFWQEFSFLFEAVAVEKLVITLILQLIVIIAIFNVVSFVAFLSEQKAKEVFLFQALGVSQKNVVKGWLMLLVLIWMVSCLVAVGFATFFKWAMLNIGFLELPGEVYNLSRIQIRPSLVSYLIAFSLALVWLIGISWPGLRKLQRESLLSRLRLGFNQ